MNKFSLELEKDKNIEVELKDLAQQANGNILVRSGDTLLLATCVMSKDPIEDRGFFPLTVDYEEKYYAAGKIKGSRFIKRESRPSDEAICNARLIDRAIRPRFNKDINREVQVITTVLSWDSENDPDVLGLVAASLSLSVSDIPWNGPIAAVRVARINGELILNPNYKEREDAKLDIVFAATEVDKELLINMIEGGSEEVDENTILEALKFAEKPLKKLIDFQNEIAKKAGKEKAVIEKPLIDADLDKEIKDFLDKKLEQVLFQKEKDKRSADLDKLKKELLLLIEEKHPEKGIYAVNFFEKEVNRIIHEKAIKEEKRADGRKVDEVRQIVCEVGVLPRTHGSGLFSRGITRALSILTLGSPGDQQLLEGMEIEGKKAFMHHYNFPPYSVGEIRPVRGPGRREIGHGMLAEKALLPLLPNPDDFPYTIRVVSEMLSSNGSTSMASVSSSCLALMDAGVPIKSLAAGIAIGLMQDKESGKYKVLTDIQGPEDHHGDMDFKVAGTKQGITAIQMDVKIDGISEKIMKEALIRAKKARLEILDVMEKTLPKPRAKLSPYAPRIVTLQINPDKIREVIGPGGKIINEIIDETGASIDIQDSGLIFITAEKEEAANKAVDWIKDIVREVEVGETFEGKVKRILAFGAFVEILPGQEGMIHISKLSDRRVEKVEDVVNIGDIVSVKVISIDEQGRIDLALLKNNK
jgi:polyribonucleotide nucleotidyltransferase